MGAWLPQCTSRPSWRQTARPGDKRDIPLPGLCALDADAGGYAARKAFSRRTGVTLVPSLLRERIIGEARQCVHAGDIVAWMGLQPDVDAEPLAVRRVGAGGTECVARAGDVQRPVAQIR